MLKNNDKIILKTLDGYYLGLNDEQKLILTKSKTDAVVCSVNANENVLGFKFQIEVAATIYFINASLEDHNFQPADLLIPHIDRKECIQITS